MFFVFPRDCFLHDFGACFSFFNCLWALHKIVPKVATRTLPFGILFDICSILFRKGVFDGSVTRVGYLLASILITLGIFGDPFGHRNPLIVHDLFVTDFCMFWGHAFLVSNVYGSLHKMVPKDDTRTLPFGILFRYLFDPVS